MGSIGKCRIFLSQAWPIARLVDCFRRFVLRWFVFLFTGPQRIRGVFLWNRDLEAIDFGLVECCFARSFLENGASFLFRWARWMGVAERAQRGPRSSIGLDRKSTRL